jgi:hypothetical protein
MLSPSAQVRRSEEYKQVSTDSFKEWNEFSPLVDEAFDRTNQEMDE